VVVTLLSLTPLFAAIALMLLAVLVRARAPKGELSEAFVFVVVMMCFWNLNFFVLYTVKSHALAVSLSRVLRTATLFLPAAILHLHLLLSLGESGTRRWQAILWVNYIFGAILAVANSVDLLVSDLRPIAWGYASVGTSYYNIFTVFMVANAAASLSLVSWQFSKTPDPRRRQQLRFWLIGATIALPLGLMNLLPAYGVAIYPPGNLGTAAWASIVAYAIIRHRLLGIEVVVTKTLAYVTVATLLISPVFALVVLMQKWAFGAPHVDFSIGLFVLLLVVGILFPRVTNWAEGKVEASLFRSKLESHRALSAFAQSVIRIFEKERILRELCKVVGGAFGAKSVCVFLVEPEGGNYSLRESSGESPGHSLIPRNHPLPRIVFRHGGAMLRAEIESQLYPGMDGATDLLRDESWDVVVPLIGPKGPLGVVCLGRKVEREAYAAGDLELLERVGVEATFALENARLYEELRRSQELIDRAGRLSALGTLAAGIAHEVRNPLVSIHTFFQLAPDRLHDEEFMTSFLKLAETEVERIGKLISELLSFARSSEALIRDVLMQEVINRTLTLMAPQAREKSILLSLEHASDSSIVVQADGDQLVQVLINIVLNAIQATPENGSVKIKLSRVVEDEGLFCEVSVADSGPGIPIEMRESIFNPFFTTKEAGTGLGLAIAYRIVADYGGSIVVSCAREGGAIFRILLPISSAATESFPPAVGAA
jgi:signal transduction histidine kinase